MSRPAIRAGATAAERGDHRAGAAAGSTAYGRWPEHGGVDGRNEPALPGLLADRHDLPAASLYLLADGPGFCPDHPAIRSRSPRHDLGRWLGEQLADRVPGEVARVCWAYMSLRLVDWSIRHLTLADVNAWLLRLKGWGSMAVGG